MRGSLIFSGIIFLCEKKKSKEHIKKCMFVFIKEGILPKVASFVQILISQNCPVK